jgi:hypothetical protein
MHGGSFVPHVMPRFSTAGLQVSSNTNPNALHQLPSRTRPWATAVLSAGQPVTITYRPFPAPLPLFPAETHSHRPSATPSAMDDLREQVELLESSANLATSISDIQQAIDQLTAARAKIAAGALPLYTLEGPTDHRHQTRTRRL